MEFSIFLYGPQLTAKFNKPLIAKAPISSATTVAVYSLAGFAFFTGADIAARIRRSKSENEEKLTATTKPLNAFGEKSLAPFSETSL